MCFCKDGRDILTEGAGGLNIHKRGITLGKNKTILTAALLCMAVSLPACVQKKEEAAAEVVPFTEPQYDWGKGAGETLTIWGTYPDLERSYLTRAFARYEELTGNQLELVQMPKEEYGRKMMAAFRGNGGQPDIILSYGGTSIEAYHPDDNFYDFTDALWVEDLTDTSINQTVYNGKIIGLPHWEASVSGTLYNKEIFKRYRLSVPRNQQEFMDVCEVLVKHGITPLYLPAKEISMLLYQFPLDAVVEDTKLLAGLNDGSLGYEDIPEMEKIVEWYRTMAQKGYLGADYHENDWSGMNEALESESYAMMLCWDTWLYTDFQGDPDTFGLMPAFIGIPDSGTFEGPNLGLFIVNKHTDKLEDALNFITFLSDPYNYNEAFAGVYTAPVFKNQVASISTPQYLEAERLIERNYRDSVAWLRIRGFSQMDASCILDYMDSPGTVTAKECLWKMDQLRNARISQ